MGTLALYPLDSRCVLLTNIVWNADENGVPSCIARSSGHASPLR